MKFIIFVFFFCSSIRAEIIKNNATELKRISFSFNDVCKYMGHYETPIIDPWGPGVLDCMGTKINLNEFCLKKEKGLELPNEKLSLTRGVNDPISKTVFCEKASSLILSYKCQKKDATDICISAGHGCNKLNQIFAIEMEISRSSLLDQEEGKILNCYFSSKNDDLISKFEK